MLVQELKTAQEFLDLASASLYQKEAEYGLMLGLTEMKAKKHGINDENKYFRIDDQQGFLGYAVNTDKNLILSDMPDSMSQGLVSHLHKNEIKVPGVIGPSHSAEAFAKIYSQIYDVAYKIAMDQKTYQLDHVVPPTGIAGSMIVADLSYLELSAQWLVEFVEECIPHELTTLEAARKFVTTKIENHELFIWVDGSCTPVASNMVTRPTKNGIAIACVYTPKEHRKNGYAAAVVAQTSQRMLDAGKKFCMLYADTTNPTSNKVYQRIGYNEIATQKNFIFLK